MINSKVDVCCGDVQARLFGAQTGCCRVGGKRISDLVENEYMSENQVRALLGGVHVTYDKSESLCCSGKIGFRKFGAESACCGQAVYNTRTQVCCMDKVRTVSYTHLTLPTIYSV